MCCYFSELLHFSPKISDYANSTILVYTPTLPHDAASSGDTNFDSLSLGHTLLHFFLWSFFQVTESFFRETFHCSRNHRSTDNKVPTLPTRYYNDLIAKTIIEKGRNECLEAPIFINALAPFALALALHTTVFIIRYDVFNSKVWKLCVTRFSCVFARRKLLQRMIEQTKETSCARSRSFNFSITLFLYFVRTRDPRI